MAFNAGFCPCRKGGKGFICCLLVCMLRALLFPSGVRAQTRLDEENPTFKYELQVPEKDPPRSFFLLKDPGRFFGILAAGGAMAIWAAEVEDADAAHDALNQGFVQTPADIGNTYGSGWVIGGGAAITWSAGAVTGNQQVASCGRDLTKSYLASGLLAVAIKNSVNRRRPSGGNLSFPSGHTTSAFSTIPVLHHYVGWKGSMPALALATGTALGRMKDRHHYLSDVIFGAALGLAVGDAVVKISGKHNLYGSLQMSGDGVSLSVPF